MSRGLNDVEWKEFLLEKLFDISSTSSGIDKCRLQNLNNGNIPYLTRTDKNNGYELFVGSQKDKYKIDSKNVITIGLDTQTVFYQNYNFYTGQNVQILKSKHLNKFIALFIIPMIKILMQKFNWGGNGATLTRLKRSKVMLPVNSKGEPDYEFMEEYIREKETELKQEYKTYIQKRVAQLQKKVDIENKEWKNFKLSKIFTFDKGNQNNMGSLQNGNIPLVSAKKVDNGYKDFVSKNNKKIFKSSCISLNNDGDGGAGIAYYQPYKMLLDSHCTALIPKLTLTKETLIFLSRAITKQRNKFGHGYAINKERLKIFQIMLPINSKNEPDYEFMHDYMSYLEQKKILEYLDYIDE